MRCAFEGVKQADFFLHDQIVTLSPVAVVVCLFEFNDKVGCNVTSRLVTHFLENELGAFRETWLHFNLHRFGLGLD